MKIYLASLGAGLVAGIAYSLMGVRSPAPPMIALIGLLGILLGEQILPAARHILSGGDLWGFVRTACAEHVLGKLPGDRPQQSA